MSERTAVLDLAGNAAVPEAHTKINVEPGGSTTARPATDDVLVVERCFGRHNEQVCVRICLRVCALAGASSIFHLRQATQPGWPCVRPAARSTDGESAALASIHDIGGTIQDLA